MCIRDRFYGVRVLGIILEEGTKDTHCDCLLLTELDHFTLEQSQELEQGEGIGTVELLETAVIAQHLILQLLQALQVILRRDVRHIVETVVTVVHDRGERGDDSKNGLKVRNGRTQNRLVRLSNR